MSYRNNRPASTGRSESTPSAPPPPVPETPRPASHPSRYTKPPKKSVPKFVTVGIPVLVVLLVAAVVGWQLLMNRGVASTIDSSKYQVVVLRDALNTPNYFGKLSVVNDRYMRLTKVYYLKQKADTEASKQTVEQQSASDFELIKLGGEIHGPQDEMIIPTEQILYFENLKPDGQVSKAIDSQTKK